jgi:hypothetical protein
MADNPNAVQISKDDLANLQGSRELLRRLLEDNEGGLELKRKIKKIVPAAQFPELDYIDAASKPITEKLSAIEKQQKELQDRLDAQKKAEEDAAAERSLRERLDAVRQQYSFTDEGMAAVIDRMKKQGSSDVEGAAAYIIGTQPKPAPTAASSGMFPSKMNLFGSGIESDDPSIVALNKDPMHWMETEALKILAEGEAA